MNYLSMTKVSSYYSTRIGLAIALIIIFHINLFSQAYPFKHYSTADGLVHAVVRKVYQDSHGFLWFGTQAGVSRYDGYNFRNYLSEGNIKSQVYDIWEDEHGTIWFATYGNGLAKKIKDDSTFIWIRKADGMLPGNYVTFIFKDNDQNIWIGNGNGLTLMKKDGTIKVYDQQLGNEHGEVYCFTREKDGTLWIGTHSGLLIGKLSIDDKLQLKKILHKPIRSLLLLKNGDVLVGISDFSNDRYGIVANFHNGLVDTLLSYKTTHSLIKAQTMFEDSNGRIWIGTGYGIYIIEDGKITHLNLENGLNNENIFDIIEDREGIMWFGTENGVIKLVPPLFLSYGMKEGLSSYEILCMLIDHKNNLWLGMWNGLNRIQADGHISYWNETNGLWHHSIKSLSEDDNGNIWIGTELGLNLFSAKKYIKKEITGFPKLSQIWSICRDSDGGMWLGTKGTIAKLVHDRTSIILGRQNGVPEDVITTLLIDHQNRLWFGTEQHGIGIYQNNVIKLLNHDHGLPDNRVHCIFQYKPGEIWIGTDRGVAIWQDDKFKALSFSTAILENNPVYFILQDSLRHLWFGTEHGLYEWTGSIMHHFSVRDGLASEVATNAIVKDDGSLWFGTKDGISYLSQSYRFVQRSIPTVYIDGVFAGDNELQIANHYVLKYSDRSLVFKFNALSFVDESTIEFQWKLAGLDQVWIGPFQQRQVRYTNLTPGEYVFHVRAANRNGEWSASANFYFRISAPYWKTWWFITLALSLISSLLLLSYRYRINQIRKIEKMRTRIAADLHDDIASSLASVSLYSEVIQHQLQTESDETRSLLNRIRELSYEVMENIGTIVWTVDPRRDELSELLQYFQNYARQICITKRITFISQLTPQLKPIVLTPEQRRTIYLILKEGLNNVLRHAYSSQVIFCCSFQNHIIDLSLQDDGQGFDQRSVNGGHGLTNMAMRAQSINSDLQITSERGKGTTIRLQLRMT